MISLRRSLRCLPQGPASILSASNHEPVVKFVKFEPRVIVMKGTHSVREVAYFFSVTLEEVVKRESAPGLVDEPPK